MTKDIEKPLWTPRGSYMAVFFRGQVKGAVQMSSKINSQNVQSSLKCLFKHNVLEFFLYLAILLQLRCHAFLHSKYNNMYCICLN